MWNQNSNGFYPKSVFFQGCTLQEINILQDFKWNYRLCSHVLAWPQIQVFAYVTSRKRRANQAKNTGYCFSTEMKATCKNSAHLEQDTKTTKVVTYPLLSLDSSITNNFSSAAVSQSSFWSYSSTKQAFSLWKPHTWSSKQHCCNQLNWK